MSVTDPFRALVFAALLAGCGITQRQFAEAFVEKYCAEHEACDRRGRPCPVSISESGVVYRDCAFDPELAEACLAATFTCDDSVPENASVIVDRSCIEVCGPVEQGE